jgi:hypothetical protein
MRAEYLCTLIYNGFVLSLPGRAGSMPRNLLQVVLFSGRAGRAGFFTSIFYLGEEMNADKKSYHDIG